MMIAICGWHCRLSTELVIWAVRTPKNISRQWFWNFAVPHTWGLLIEVAFHVGVVFVFDGRVGNHGLWLSPTGYFLCELGLECDALGRPLFFPNPTQNKPPRDAA